MVASAEAKSLQSGFPCLQKKGLRRSPGGRERTRASGAHNVRERVSRNKRPKAATIEAAERPQSPLVAAAEAKPLQYTKKLKKVQDFLVFLYEGVVQWQGGEVGNGRWAAVAQSYQAWMPRRFPKRNRKALGCLCRGDTPASRFFSACFPIEACACCLFGGVPV